MDARQPTANLYWVRERRLATDFPSPDSALTDPDGLLAIGGCLSPTRLLAAYRCGIFPWYSDGQPLLWWSPDPRTVLAPGNVHVSRSLSRTERRGGFELSWDRAFGAVIEACAAPRAGHTGTWITADMRDAYVALHRLGYAHSFECWRDGELAGGVYGVALGAVFFGESMFSCRRDASKLALVGLCRQLARWGYQLLDCQMHTAHLASMGAEMWPRARFLATIARCIDCAPAADAWHIKPPAP